MATGQTTSGCYKGRSAGTKLCGIKDDAQKCNHQRETVFLRHNFLTDMLVIELHIEAAEINTAPNSLEVWLLPALATLSETLALAAGQTLDIEFNDLKAGYRLRYQGREVFADIFLYDSLSSGAGYASRIAEFIDAVLDRAEKILDSCRCSTSCPDLLNHHHILSDKAREQR